MRAIAQELSVTTGALYHHFPNKQTILEAVFVALPGMFVQELTGSLQADETREDRLYRLANFLTRRETSLQQSIQISLEQLRQNNVPQTREAVRSALSYNAAALHENVPLASREEGIQIVQWILGTLTWQMLSGESVDWQQKIKDHFHLEP